MGKEMAHIPGGTEEDSARFDRATQNRVPLKP